MGHGDQRAEDLPAPSLSVHAHRSPHLLSLHACSSTSSPPPSPCTLADLPVQWLPLPALFLAGRQPPPFSFSVRAAFGPTNTSIFVEKTEKKAHGTWCSFAMGGSQSRAKSTMTQLGFLLKGFGPLPPPPSQSLAVSMAAQALVRTEEKRMRR